jgi:hypothetical protein
MKGFVCWVWQLAFSVEGWLRLAAKEIRMRHLFFPAITAALAIALWAGLGNPEEAPFSVSGLINPHSLAIDATYKSRHKYKSHACAGDEIPALQRSHPAYSTR